MSVVRFCNAAGCREIIPVGKRYCKKHEYIQAEVDSTYKRRRELAGMTDEQRHQYNKRVYRKRMATSAKAKHNYNRFYKSTAWRKLSHQTLLKRPVCVLCLANGIIKKADLVDHIVPIRADWSKRLDPENLQPLCYHCHIEKTREDRQKYKSEQ